ncbi:hypothetical protein [Aeromonas hydrophila]|uniref:hypothetical protein n=1 Tax=Aeromonas hydrophila TaxID=644 RepID=UPI002B48F095|nr:hypothetical protein [Aeromonas hydrophila]
MEGSKKSFSWLELMIVIGGFSGIVCGLAYGINKYGPEVKAAQSQQVELKKAADK